MKNTVTSLSLVVLFSACGTQSDLDVGDETANVGQALSDYAANWDGYGEAYAAPGDAEDRVRLTLDQNGVGTIRLGEEAVFGAATDPNGTYPPTYSQGDDISDLRVLAGLRSGFEYPVSGAVVSEDRLRLDIQVFALMEGWCALQPAQPAADWTCGGTGWGATLDDVTGELICESGNGDGVRLDCDVAVQCQYCTCDIETNTCHTTASDTLVFDAALTDDGDTLEGTLVTGDNERVTVRMTR